MWTRTQYLHIAGRGIEYKHVGAITGGGVFLHSRKGYPPATVGNDRHPSKNQGQYHSPWCL